MTGGVVAFEELGAITARYALVRFLRESLVIEGIHRDPTNEEIKATEKFLIGKTMTVDAICRLQAVYAPGMPLRIKEGMNVRVGRYVAPAGGAAIGYALAEFCERITGSDNPWRMHAEFEKQHPFLDGNGRTGRAIWAWHMLRPKRDPFALPFLHRFHYQTLDNVDRGDE